MGLGIPSFVKSVVNDGKKAVHAVAPIVEHPVRTAEGLGKTLARDGFDLADKGVQALSSAKNKRLDREELVLAGLAANRTQPQAVRTKARDQMRRLMGAERLDRLDPLPPEASALAEQQRTASATTWDPSKDPAGSKAQWGMRDVAGHHRSDPVNFYVHGKLSDIVRAFQKGGWSIAEKGPAGVSDYTGALKQYFAHKTEGVLPFFDGVSQTLYHTVNKMPVSEQYLNGQRQLVGMQANNHPLSGRDHFRIFATGKKDAQGNNIYAIAASRDEGQKLDLAHQKTAYLNHFMEKNVDAERDYVLKTLLASGEPVGVKALSRTTAGGPRNGLYSADGKVYELTIGEKA